MTANDEVTREVERELASRGWSRSRFARESGTSPAWVTRKLEGDRRWSVDDLDLLGRVLGLRLTLSHAEDDSGLSAVETDERPLEAVFARAG